MHHRAASSVFNKLWAQRIYENSSTGLWCRENSVEELEEKLSKAAGALRLTVLGFRAVGCVLFLMELSQAQTCSKQICSDSTAQHNKHQHELCRLDVFPEGDLAEEHNVVCNQCHLCSEAAA